MYVPPVMAASIIAQDNSVVIAFDHANIKVALAYREHVKDPVPDKVTVMVALSDNDRTVVSLPFLEARVLNGERFTLKLSGGYSTKAVEYLIRISSLTQIPFSGTSLYLIEAQVTEPRPKTFWQMMKDNFPRPKPDLRDLAPANLNRSAQ